MPRINPTAVILAATLAVIAAPALAESDSGSPALAWKAGQKLEVTEDNRETATQTLPTGMSQETEAHQRMTYEITIGAIDDAGVATCELRIARVAVKQKGPVGSYDYDSGDPEKRDVEQAAPYRALVGATLTLKMSPHGECLSVSGTDKMVDRMVEDLDESEREAARSIVGKMVNDDAMRGRFRQIFVAVPDDAATGSKWSQKHEINVGFGFVATMWKYEIGGIEDDEMTIAAEVEATEGSRVNPNMPFEMKVSGVKRRGTITVDRTHPLLPGLDHTIQIDLSLSMQGITIPTTIDRETKIRSRTLDE